jgi:hypothetical protein
MESVEQFLKRGGRIQSVPIQRVQPPKKLPHGRALKKRLRREASNNGLGE